jgi:ParB-like chromosome segregation protein Spo0J
MEAESIPINLITVNKQAVGGDRVEEFVELLEDGKKLSPITVRKISTGYVLVDGRHRLLAHKRLEKTHILARITL